jgi:hypothetical protein
MEEERITITPPKPITYTEESLYQVAARLSRNIEYYEKDILERPVKVSLRIDTTGENFQSEEDGVVVQMNEYKNNIDVVFYILNNDTQMGNLVVSFMKGWTVLQSTKALEVCVFTLREND